MALQLGRNYVAGIIISYNLIKYKVMYYLLYMYFILNFSLYSTQRGCLTWKIRERKFITEANKMSILWCNVNVLEYVWCLLHWDCVYTLTVKPSVLYGSKSCWHQKQKKTEKQDRRTSGPKGQDVTRQWKRLLWNFMNCTLHCTGWLQTSVTTHSCAALLAGFALPNCAEFAALNRNTNWVFYGALYHILVKWLPRCRLVTNRQNTKKRNLKSTSDVFHYLSYNEESGETFSNLLLKFVIVLYQHFHQIKKDWEVLYAYGSNRSLQNFSRRISRKF
jgi:hypothetical protein